MTATAPTLLSVLCTAGLPQPAFSLTWQPQGGYNGPFLIVVTDMGGAAVAGTSSDVGASSGKWQAEAGAMQAGGFYQVRIQAGTDGPLSASATLLFEPPTNLVTVYDGTTVTLTWTPPAGPPPGQSLVLFSAGGFVQAFATENQSGVTFVPDPAQTPKGVAWSVTVTPTQSPATGPTSASATVFNVAPTLSIIDIDTTDHASSRGAAWISADGLPAQASFVATLWQDDRPVFTTPVTAGEPISNSGADFFKILFDFGPPGTPYRAGLNYRATVAQAIQVATAVSQGPQGAGLPLFPWRALITDVETNLGATADDRAVTISAEVHPGTPPFAGIKGAVRPDPQGETFYNWSKGPLKVTINLTDPDLSAPFRASCAPFSGSSRGPYEDFGPWVLAHQPALDAVEYDNGVVSARWTAPQDPNATGYRLQVVDGGGRVVAETSSQEAQAALATPGVGLSVQVRQTGDRTVGPASAPAALIPRAPTSLVAAWTALGDKGLLEWDPVEGAGAYEIEVWFVSRRVAVWTVPATGKPSAELPRGEVRGRGHFRVRATSADGAAPVIAGPWSAPGPIIASTPKSVAVRYDGRLARVTWDAVPEASSYQISVLEGTSVTHGPFVVTGTATEFALPFDANTSWTLVAQAADGFTKGPGSVPIPVFNGGWYLSASADQTAIKPAVAQAMTDHDIVLDLPEIFATPPATLPTDPTFVLARASGAFAYSLTIPAGSLAWTFGTGAVREELRGAYLAFIAALEAATATPAGLSTVQQAIGRAMPQTFAETLFYNYGLRAEQGCVDLRPGMMLRAEYETYQFLGGAAPDAAYLNGYVASASSEYQVASYGGSGSWLIGFDRFLAAIAAAGGLTVPTPAFSQRKMQGAGGVIDTLYAQFRRPFVRLVYPPSFQTQNSAGNPSPEYNAVLLAANRLDALETATANIRNGLEAGADVALLYFRGRTTLTAGVQVWLENESLSVPLGTTLANLLERRAERPPAVALPFSRISLTRSNGAAVTGQPTALALDSGRPVLVDWTQGSSPAWLDLPLLHGDRLIFG
jgi:hypothetical protein